MRAYQLYLELQKQASYLPVYAIGGLGGAAIGALGRPDDAALTPHENRRRRLRRTAAGAAVGLGAAAVVHATRGQILDWLPVF